MSKAGQLGLNEGTAEPVEWPDDEQGRYAEQFLRPLLEQSVTAYIRNVETSLHILTVSGHAVPVTVNDTQYDSSYVCSPYTHYVTYAKEELRLVGLHRLQAPLSALLNLIGLLFKATRFNRVVQINNWLLSTNLYPDMPAEEWLPAIGLLRDRFPDHTLIFRSLNRSTNALLIDELIEQGFRLVPSRQIYMLRPSDDASLTAKARWLVKRDYGLLAKRGYERVGPNDLTEADIPRLAELYRALYLDKYSTCNPQLTDRFFALALSKGLLEFHALRSMQTGCIDAMLGYFSRNGVMTTPVFGYDTSLPQELGLYRMLSAVLLDIARNNGCLLHESSGAAQFKRNRGAVAEIEYSAVYDRHLPVVRRAGWSVLRVVLNRLGVPLMRRFKL